MSEEQQRVEPRTLKGFQDLLPEDVLPRRDVIQKIETVFQRYGFCPLETPALEYLDTLLGVGGEETNKALFRLQTPEEEDIALRFDLTVPFARLLAQYPDKLKTPFRRYALGPVWRADKPGPGRLRQFTQFDVDVAGSDSVAADAEIIAIMCEVMTVLGVSDFSVLVNHRKAIDALLEGCGIAEFARQKHVLRVIDKLQKAGIENVRLELGGGRVDESGDPIPGVRLDAATIDRVVQFIGVTDDSRAGVIAKLETVLPDSESARQALADLREINDCLGVLNVPEEHARFDASLARGLDYYTGPVYETVLPAAPEFGSVMGGGRYDQLVERFLDRPIPCTGMAVGLDRLLAALRRLGADSSAKTVVQALIVTLGAVAKSETLKAAAELRAAGIRTETYFGKKMTLKSQLSHADHYEIPVAVIIGEDEIAKGVVSVKDLRAGKHGRADINDHEAYRKAGRDAQVTVPRSELVKTVAEFLNRG